MPIVRSAESPKFRVHGAEITGLAAPSRGSREVSVWRVRIESGTTPEHTLDAEEIFALTAGRAVFVLNGVEHEVGAGDTIIVPAGATLSFRVDPEVVVEAFCAMRTGGQARMAIEGASAFYPPWTE